MADQTEIQEAFVPQNRHAVVAGLVRRIDSQQPDEGGHLPDAPNQHRHEHPQGHDARRAHGDKEHRLADRSDGRVVFARADSAVAPGRLRGGARQHGQGSRGYSRSAPARGRRWSVGVSIVVLQHEGGVIVKGHGIVAGLQSQRLAPLQTLEIVVGNTNHRPVQVSPNAGNDVAFRGTSLR